MLKILLSTATSIALTASLFTAPARAYDETRHEGDEATITGCLTQAARHDDEMKVIPGAWVLADIEDGERVLVKGDRSLENHDANHEVEVTGVWMRDLGPELTEDYDDYLMVKEVRHVAATCEAPSNPDDSIG